MIPQLIILLTKTIAAQNEAAHSYHKVRGLYFLAVVFAATIHHTFRTLQQRMVNIIMYNLVQYGLMLCDGMYNDHQKLH